MQQAPRKAHLIVVQHGVTHGLTQQHTICHVLEHCFSGGAILETDGVAHLLTKCHVQFLQKEMI